MCKTQYQTNREHRQAQFVQGFKESLEEVRGAEFQQHAGDDGSNQDRRTAGTQDVPFEHRCVWGVFRHNWSGFHYQIVQTREFKFDGGEFQQALYIFNRPQCNHRSQDDEWRPRFEN